MKAEQDTNTIVTKEIQKMKDIITIINISGIDCYEKDGVAYLRLETVARGLGFTQTQTKGGREYTSIRWERVDQYLAELGFPHKWGKELVPDGAVRPEFIPENIFYRLAMKAKNESAEAFQAKIADEVIPSIRKHGAYMTPDTIDKMISSPEFGIKLLTALKDEQARNRDLAKTVEAQSQTIEQQKPKVLFAEAVAAAHTSILVGELAKLIKQNGVEIGQNRLFQWMRDNGYIIKRNGSDYNLPTQKSMELGLMEVKETSSVNPDGSIRLNKTPKVTGKGQQYFIEKFLVQEKESA